jgi:iron complex transport system substrate-binding protein
MEMKRSTIGAVLLLLIAASVGCQPTVAPSPTALPTEVPAPTEAPVAAPIPTEEPAPAAQGEPVLELVGIDGSSQKLTLEELKALPAYEGWGGSVTSTGRITPPAEHRGVGLQDLCALVGGLEPGMGVRVVAEDGYAMTISYDQIVNGDFTVYDPGTGGESTTADQLRVVLTYEREGQPLPEREDGTLRLGLLNSSNDHITDGHWWVKWVNQVTIKSLAEEWTLHLEGALSEDMDRNTFESCSSPSCHGATWTDDSNQVWMGTPLWLLAGRVDDEEPHKDEAFNRALAEDGYSMDVVASDGYSVTLEASRIQQVADILVAYLVNENPLDEKHFPLRLVGDGLDRSEMVGQIVSIVVHPPEGAELAQQPTAQSAEATEVPAAAEPVACDGALGVGGVVAVPACWTLEEFEVMGVVKRTVEHPKSGEQTYQGLPLTALMALLQPAGDTVVFSASDGYSVKVPLSDVLACTDCMVALDGEGGLVTVMPGFESMNWVKDLTTIVVQ